MDPVFLVDFGVDTDFSRDSSTYTVFSNAVQGGNAAQTVLRPRQVATAYRLDHNEGAKIGEPPASLTPTRPESTDNTRQVAIAYRLDHNEGAKIGEPPASLTLTSPESSDNTRQPTARSARRIARHAAIAAAQASVDLATAVDASADLTSTVQASADLTSAVHGSADLASAVHDPADLTSVVHAPARLTIAIQTSPAVPTTVCRATGVLPPAKLVRHLLSVFLLTRRRRALPRPCALPHPCALLRPRAMPPRLRLPPVKPCCTKVHRDRVVRPSACVSTARRPVAADRARPRRPASNESGRLPHHS